MRTEYLSIFCVILSLFSSVSDSFQYLYLFSPWLHLFLSSSFIYLLMLFINEIVFSLSFLSCFSGWGAEFMASVRECIPLPSYNDLLCLLFTVGGLKFIFLWYKYSYSCFLLVSICMGYIFPSLPFQPVLSLRLKWVSYRQQRVGSCHSVSFDWRV